MKCNFIKRQSSSILDVKVGDRMIPKVLRFKSLGSIIQNDRFIKTYVNHRTQGRWLIWRRTLGVLYDAKVPLKLKEKFHRTIVRLKVLYGT
jgi:hypothetical protein